MFSAADGPSAEHKRRLLYRSVHRGCKETDILLETFARKHLHLLNDDQIEEYEKIVELDDALLYSYVVGSVPIPDNIDRGLIGLIADYAKQKK